VARVKDWRSLGRDALEAALVQAIRQGGPEALRPILRARAAPQATDALLFDPLLELLVVFRTATPRQALFLGLWTFAAVWMIGACSFEGRP
jgi:hypothetical protein